MRRSLRDRVRGNVVVNDQGCWIWQRRVDRDGYGRISLPGGERDEAHRVAYVVFRGAIPAGHTLDHTCHNSDPFCPAGRACDHRRCVNPWHLEPALTAVNTARAAARRALPGAGALMTLAEDC